MQTEQNNSQKEIQNKKSFKLKVKEWFTKKPNFLIRILIPTIIFVELLHYLLKEIIFLEAWAILTVFIISYIAIIVLFIAKKRDNFFVKHFILTFFFGVFLYNYVTYPSYTYRYRMTVEVETPEGLKTGSSVIEVHTEQWNSWLAGISNGHRASTDIRGEGVIVEIDNDSALLVLMGKGSYNDHARYMLAYAVPMKEWNIDWNNPTDYEKAWYGVNSRKAIRYYGTLKKNKGILRKELYPLCLIATNINSDNIGVLNIYSVKQEKSLEDEFVIKKITIETTNDSLEWKIRKSSNLSKLKDYIWTRNTLDYVISGLSVGKTE